MRFGGGGQFRTAKPPTKLGQASWRLVLTESMGQRGRAGTQAQGGRKRIPTTTDDSSKQLRAPQHNRGDAGETSGGAAALPLRWLQLPEHTERVLEALHAEQRARRAVRLAARSRCAVVPQAARRRRTAHGWVPRSWVTRG